MIAPDNRMALQAQLAGLFRSEHSALSALRTLLEQEQAALGDMDMDAVVKTSADKSHLLASLQPLAAERSRLFVLAGLDESHQGLNSLLDLCDADATLREQATINTDLAAHCQSLNLSNGVQIKKNQHFISGALNCLIGDDTHRYYSAGGSQTSGREGRSITSA